MDERQRREKAIRKYEKGESPKDIYTDLKRSESWFFRVFLIFVKRQRALSCFIIKIIATAH